MSLVILSGPSGVGKDTVIEAWREANPLVDRVVACTSRSPRKGEVDGVDYHFLESEEFAARVEDGRFLEYKLVHGNYYGTPFDGLERLIQAGSTPILKIDVQGALAVMDVRPDAVTIFLLPPSMEELENRIRSRQLDTPEVIERRLVGAREELALAHWYQHQVVNITVADTVCKLQEIVGK